MRQASPEAAYCYPPGVLEYAKPDYPGYWYAVSRKALEHRVRDRAAAEKALAMAEARHEYDLIPFLLLSYGEILNSGEDRHAEALSQYRRAAEMASQWLDIETASLARAMVAAEVARLGDVREARRICSDLVLEAQATGHDRMASERAAGLAGFCLDTGDFECARRNWEVRLEFTERTRDVPAQVGVLYRLGEVEVQAGYPAAAVKRLQAGIDLGYEHQRPFLLRTLASAYQMTGNSFLAVQCLTQSRELFRARGMKWQAGADTGSLGTLYASLGDDARAETCFRTSLASARENRDLADEQRILMALTRLLIRQNRLKEAAAAVGGALDRANRVRLAIYLPSLHLVMAEVAMREGQKKAARGHLEQSLKLARELSRYEDEVQALVRLGDWHLAMSQRSEAGAAFQDAIHVATSHALVWPTADAYRSLGRLEAGAGRYKPAWDQFRAAIDVVDTLRAGVPDNDVHLGFSRKMWPLYEDAVNALAWLGSASEALEISERGRARAVLDQLPALSNGERPHTLDARAMQSYARESREAILTYVLSEPESTAWIVDGDQIRMARLPAKREIERMVRRHRQSLARLPSTEDAQRKDLSRRLYSVLVAPLAEILRPGQKLAVIPDGILYYLPFETLVTPSGQFLIEDHPVVYAPSVSIMASLSSSRPASNPRVRMELLAYGDPLFSAGGGGGGSAGSFYRSAGFHFIQLPATRDEVAGIGAFFAVPARTLHLGRAASEQSVKQENLASYRRLHFATHAVLDEKVPARSGIVLSLVNTGREDGVLHATEIAELKLDADLAVLSACQTGLGQMVSGEGMVGLTRAFFHAGARQVAVSLWDVNDQSTARLMKEFYRHMSAGESPAAALREAKLSFLHAAAPAYRHPHFWAGFVLSGAD